MPSVTQMIQPLPPGLLGSNTAGSHKRKRNGNLEDTLLSSQDPATLYKANFSTANNVQRISSLHEPAAQRINSNLPVMNQMHGSWVAGEHAIHKRRRCSNESPGISQFAQNTSTYESPHATGSAPYSREAPNSSFNHLARSQNTRTACSPYSSTQIFDANAIRAAELKDRYNTYNNNSQIDTGMSLPQLHLHAQMQTPCHICHKKPRYKDELEHFTFCQECGERTCTICLRECLNGLDYEYSVHTEEERSGVLAGVKDNQNENNHINSVRGFHDGGWVGESGNSLGHNRVGRNRRGQRHKEKICSACCVERGEDGDVFCVGCIEEEGKDDWR